MNMCIVYFIWMVSICLLCVWKYDFRFVFIFSRGKCILNQILICVRTKTFWKMRANGFCENWWYHFCEQCRMVNGNGNGIDSNAFLPAVHSLRLGRAQWRRVFVWKSYAFCVRQTHWMAGVNSIPSEHSQSRAIEAENKFFTLSADSGDFLYFHFVGYGFPAPAHHHLGRDRDSTHSQTFTNFTVDRAPKKAVATSDGDSHDIRCAGNEKCTGKKCMHALGAQQ